MGDPKQAIYGFRDTDPDLINDVWINAGAVQVPDLSENHRSQKGLVQIVGRLFSPVFGESAVQTPQKAPLPRGVERWILNTSNQPADAVALACGISQLHAEGIRFGDMAVLERTNRLLGSLVLALEDLGIPYLLDSPGLLSTREGVLLLAGLRLVADRNDSLAAATVVHLMGDPTVDTPVWLEQRLQSVRATEQLAEGDAGESRGFSLPWEGDARLSAIEHIDRQTLSPTLAVQQLIAALNLPCLVQKWGDPGRRCANLDSVIDHARQYEEMALDTGQSATVAGLILCLEQLARCDQDLRYSPLGHDAVTLTTYHSAKGLEWPVVVLSGLHTERDPDMWSPVVTGGGRSNDDPLSGRVLQTWTWPFGYSEGQYGGLATGSGLEDDALASTEGLERSNRALQESIRLLYVGCTRAQRKLVLAHRPDKYDWLKRIPAVDTLLGCSLGAGEHMLDGIDTTFVLRELDAIMVDECRVPAVKIAQWISVSEVSTLPRCERRFHHPSQADATMGPDSFRVENLGGPAFFPAGAKQEQYSAIGDAVHRYFAALPSRCCLEPAQKAAVAERCLAAFSVTGVLSASDMVMSGDRFCAWVDMKYLGARWTTEVPATAPRATGGQWNGTIDLLLELQDGSVIIVDHKSAPIRHADCGAKAATFSGQLAAYREMISSAGFSVGSVWVHFPLAGVVVESGSPS